MKNVAATSGQSVSFATRVFLVETACAGYWVGRDRELNFYFSSSDTHSRAAVKRVRISKNTRVVSACKKNLRLEQIIFYSYSELGMSYSRLLLFLRHRLFQREPCKYRLAAGSVYDRLTSLPAVINSAVCLPFTSFRSLCECLIVFLRPLSPLWAFFSLVGALPRLRSPSVPSAS